MYKIINNLKYLSIHHENEINTHIFFYYLFSWALSILVPYDNKFSNFIVFDDYSKKLLLFEYIFFEPLMEKN